MNRGIWLVLEVIFDTLMFAPYLLRGRFSWRIKARVLATYTRLTCKFLFLDPVRPLDRERLFGWTIRCFDYRTFHLLCRVILLRNEYYFEAPTPRPLVLDCGANIGLATVFFKWLYPEAEVHAFEPDPATFALLKENVEANHLSGVHVYNVALSDGSGTAAFHVDHAHPGAPRMSLNPLRMPKDTVTVRTIALSELLGTLLAGRQVDFLKLDVEGAEDAVLRDLAGKGCLKAVRELLIEFHHKIGGERARLASFLSVLESQGFDYQLDAVCMPLYERNRYQNVMVYAYRD